ncbi:MAG: hypothetical protein M3347_06885, partial [Armatimonadota bacterium]|nr:hypothetical protein [Armatimonadota bacterium]
MTDLTLLHKVELHCHLDGILDRAMVRELHQDDPSFPIAPAAFERAYPVDSYESFVRWWEYIDPLEGDIDNFRPVLSRHIERLKAQRVVYFELMIAAGEIPKDPVAAVEKIGALREWINELERGVIQIEFLIAFGRNKPPEHIAKLTELFLRLHEAGLIVGVALAGPEAGHPVKPLHRSFARLHEAGLGIEIHAGEWCGPESVWDALQYGFPNRIGHGVTLFDDPKLIEAVRERGIHIEMCPTS